MEVTRQYQRFEVALPTGLEPVAFGLGNRRSIHLSYGSRPAVGCKGSLCVTVEASRQPFGR